MIRQIIVELYRQNGAPPPLDQVATRVGTSVQAVNQGLSTEPKLDDLCGLSLTQAHELIQFYGPDVLFVESLASAVSDAVSTQERLKRIESRKGSGNDVPPASSRSRE